MTCPSSRLLSRLKRGMSSFGLSIGTQKSATKGLIASELHLRSLHIREGGELTHRYLPAIFDPESRTLTLAPATPLYLLSHRVKRMKPPATDPLAHLQKEVNMYRMQRNDLGETFGTRKAKSRIKAQERNKVDAGAMEGAKGHLMDAIGEKTEEEGGSTTY